jgi:anthranilate synthase component 1
MITLEQEYTLLENDVETPISLFLRQVGAEQGILLESAEVDGRWGRYSVVAGNFLLRLGCKNGLLEVASRDPRLDPLKRHAGTPFMEGLRECMNELTVLPAPGTNLPPITRGLFGYFEYGMASIFEPKLANPLSVADAACCLVLPGVLTLFDHQYNKVCRLSLTKLPGAGKAFEVKPESGQAEIGPISLSMEKAAYMQMAENVRERIRQGGAIQIVPSLHFQASFEGDAFALYRRLRRINPSPYLFFMRLPDLTLMGSSPEVMVGCQDGTLRLSPIAGTRPRGEGVTEDNLFEDELLADPKEQAEHVMLVDLGRNDLGRVAEPGSVKLDRFMEVERFSPVMHLSSYISATPATGVDALDVLRAVFPAGTVSGAPKIRAMEIIAEMERRPRGPYAGAIGWLGLDKNSLNMDLGITIRSLWIKDGQAHWQAGAGLVYDSNPESEWNECLHKAEAMLAAVNV